MQYTTPRRMLSAEEKEEKARLRAEREAVLRDRNNRLGITVFQGSWIMVFVCLIVVNWQLRFSAEWMPIAESQPSAVLPTIATVLLLISSVLTHRALSAVKADHGTAFQQQWFGATALGALFFIIMLSQFLAVIPAGGQFVAVYRLMIGYHILHALVIGIMMIQVYRYAGWGRYNAANNWSVEATMRLWDFVTVAWIAFFVVLYVI